MALNTDSLSHECRFCRSKKNLISLFSGKTRTPRDYLRKLIYDLIGIRIEQDDNVSTRICIVCSTYICNFYNFKVLATASEEMLKEAYNGHSSVKMKFRAVSLADISLPAYEILQEELFDWLKHKLQETIEPDEKTTSYPCKTVNSSYTQTECRTQSDKFSQTNFETHNKYVQVHAEQADSTTQCGYLNNRQDKEIQVEIPMQIAIEDHNESLGEVQGNKTNNCSEADYHKNSYMNNLLLCHKKNEHKKVICDNCKKFPNLRSRTVKPCVKQFDEVSIQTNTNGDNKSTNTELTGDMLSYYNINETDRKVNTSLFPFTQNTLQMCSPSFPQIKDELLSPAKEPLHIFTEPIEKATNNDCPKNSVISPQGLLRVEEKHDVVLVCDRCDKLCYSKKESVQHRKIHLHCPLCKRKFRSYQTADKHKELCQQKPEVKGNVYIPLERVDHLNNAYK